MKRFLAIACCAATISCAGPRYQGSAVSAADLRAAAHTLEASSANSEVIYDRTLDEYLAILERVGTRLMSNVEPMCIQAELSDCSFSLTFVDEDIVNAAAFGDQEILVFRGLLRLLKSEDEVAFVVAHELGHHLAKHGETAANNAEIVAGAAMYASAGLLGILLYSTGALDGTPAVESAEVQGQLAFSKEFELEADLLAAYLLERAGYDSKQAERIWEVFYGISGQPVQAWYDTHPADHERLAHWRAVTSEARASSNMMPTMVGQK